MVGLCYGGSAGAGSRGGVGGGCGDRGVGAVRPTACAHHRRGRAGALGIGDIGRVTCGGAISAQPP